MEYASSGRRVCGARTLHAAVCPGSTAAAPGGPASNKRLDSCVAVRVAPPSPPRLDCVLAPDDGAAGKKRSIPSPHMRRPMQKGDFSFPRLCLSVNVHLAGGEYPHPNGKSVDNCPGCYASIPCRAHPAYCQRETANKSMPQSMTRVAPHTLCSRYRICEIATAKAPTRLRAAYSQASAQDEIGAFLQTRSCRPQRNVSLKDCR